MQLYGGSGFPQVLIHLLIEQICLKEGKWLDEVEVWLSNLAPRCSLCSLKVVWKKLCGKEHKDREGRQSY